MDHNNLQRILEDLERSGVLSVAEELERSGVFDTAQRLKDFGILDTAERLERSGVLDAAKHVSELQAGLERSGIGNIKDRLAEAQMGPLAQLQADQLESLARVHENMVSSIDPQAYLAASNLAAQTLNAFHQSGLHNLETIYTERFGELIERATNWASAPYTQDLLRRANDVLRAEDVSSVEATEIFPSELPDLSQLEWVFELDRDTLIFLFKFLFHLTAILSPALGVAAALSDGEVDIEDLGGIVGALNVVLAYVLLALQKKGD